MTDIVWDAGGEDGYMIYGNGSVGGGVTIHTTGTTFRSTWCRCSIGFSGAAITFGIRKWAKGVLAAGFTTARICVSGAQSAGTSTATPYIGLVDTSNVLRIGVYAGTTSTLNVYKIDASGTKTLLFSTPSTFSNNPTTPDKIDIQFNYSTSGYVSLRLNGSLLGSYTGDVTTDGVTSVAGVYYSAASPQPFVGPDAAYSEMATTPALDTGSLLGVATQSPVANGTLDQWTGGVSNINKTTVNDSTYDTTVTAGQVQRYTWSTIPAPTNSQIVAVFSSYRATQGGGSLAHLKHEDYIGGVRYQTADYAVPTAFGEVQVYQEQSPATSSGWAYSELNAVGYEAGAYSAS